MLKRGGLVAAMRAITRRSWYWMVALVRLGTLSRDLALRMGAVEESLSKLTTLPALPFSWTRPAEAFLAQAEARLGQRSGESRGADSFLSYFSEIWGQDYEKDRERQYAAYLPHIPKSSEHAFLDLGCGAGEFVAFLVANGVKAKGIDSNAAEVKRALARGLDIQHADGLEFLRATKDRYVGISLIEVAEHIPLPEMEELVRTAISRLVPGGVLILETINMKHPLALNGFYVDPTHVRPVPEEYLSFLVQWYGLEDTEIVFTNPVWTPAVHHRDLTRIYYSYAVVGRRLGGVRLGAAIERAGAAAEGGRAP